MYEAIETEYGGWYVYLVSEGRYGIHFQHLTQGVAELVAKELNRELAAR